MNGKYWAKVSKRGIIERKRAKIENPYLNAHLHINMNLHIYFSRKSFKGSRRSCDNELFLMRTLKRHNPAIRDQIKKRCNMCILIF